MSAQLPSDSTGRTVRRPSREDLLRVYRESRTIAVVGASSDAAKPAGYVPKYLASQGYELIPINPRGGEIVGRPVHGSLKEVDRDIDVVDVFRPPAEAAAIAREAIAVGASVLWFQPGTQTAEATAIAASGGLLVVTRLCMGETHATLGLGPGPHAAEHADGA